MKILVTNHKYKNLKMEEEPDTQRWEEEEDCITTDIFAVRCHLCWYMCDLYVFQDICATIHL